MNPDLRFKDQCGNEFPDWEEKKFYETSVFRRGSFPQPYGLPEWYDEINGKPFIQVADVSDNMFVYDETKQNISKLAEPRSVFVPKGTIIVTIQGTIGRVAITPYDAYVDRTLLIIQRNKMDMDIEYQSIALYNIFNKEKRKADGGILKTITKETLKNFIIPIPDIKEQEKIAKLIKNIDKKIETQAILIEKLRNTKDAMFANMFPQGDSKVPEIRFDGFSEEWEEKKIGEILKICYGKDYKHLGDGDIPVYGTGGIMTYVNDYLCDWPCVCIGRKGTIDKPQYIDIPFWCVDTLFFSKPNIEQSPLFQYYLFHKINWNSYNAATGVPSLNGHIIEKIKVKVPRYEEQVKIGQFFANLDREIEINQQKYDKLCDVKKALLSKLFPTKEDE